MIKKTIVIHSGGMDSSICLALALRAFAPSEVLSLSFSYRQRHALELERAAKISRDWGVDHQTLCIDWLSELTESALMNPQIPIEHLPGLPPNTLVVGRNGLMARLGAILAQRLGAKSIYMGVIEVEGSHSGYRDCSRKYMDLLQEILRLDLAEPQFEIRTPIVKMSKAETMELADSLGILNYLFAETISCYEGVPLSGCGKCPACKLRNEGLNQFFERDSRRLHLYPAIGRALSEATDQNTGSVPL